MKIVVLGAGMVGSAIALDLCQNYEVTSIDFNSKQLASLQKRQPKIQIIEHDLRDYASFPSLLQNANLVITAVPGFMGFETLRHVILCGKNVVDISFSPENALELDAIAKKNQVTAIVDCGVAPGMSNLIIGRYDQEFKIKEFEIYVGGLPLHPKPPFNYKAPFSPIDVIEEYTRPARMKKDGEVIVKPALSDLELLTFEEVGQLEAFNTDGLRTLLFTMGHIPNQTEKTLRYPGHAQLISTLQSSGFFDREAIQILGNKISPLEFTSQLLVKDWKLDPNEEEFTVMKVILKGEGKKVEYSLLDYYDKETNTSSMARTTGYTCCAAANLILKNMFHNKGIFPPEWIGSDNNCFEFVLDYLKKRKVIWKRIS